MKLFNFPYIVQKNILKQMKYSEVFFMSFTSKRCEELIIRIKWREIIRILYAALGNCVKISARNKEGNRTKFFRIFTNRSLQSHHETEKIELNEEQVSCLALKYNEFDDVLEISDEIFKSYMKEARIDYMRKRKAFRWPDLAIHSNNFLNDPAIEAIHKRIEKLFGSHITYDLIPDALENNTDDLFLPTFIPFKITRCDEINNTDMAVRAELLNDYFSVQPIHQFISLFAMRVIGPFSPDSKIFQAETLSVLCGMSQNSSADFLTNFRGRNLYMSNATFQNEDVIQILRQWKAMEKYQHLKTLRILSRFALNWNPEMIRNEAGFEEIDGDPKEDPLSSDGRDNYDDSNMKLLVDQKYFFSSYIVRKDGIVAYVTATSRHVALEVQEFTVDEMLRRD